jgi:hypothetical protein
MDRNGIVQLIGEEITKLERARELLSAQNGNRLLANHKVKGSTGRTKRVLSQDARNRIAQAQKRRWAKQRREALLAKNAS